MTLRQRARAVHHLAIETARMLRWIGAHERATACRELRRAAHARAVWQHADRLEAAC